MNCTFIYENHLDDATLTATSEAAGFPIIMVQDPERTKRWRSTSAADQEIEGVQTEERLFSALVLIDHNLTTAGTIKLEASGQTWEWDAWEPVYPWGYGPFGEGLLGGYLPPDEIKLYRAGTIRVVFFDPTRLTTWKLTLSDPDNPDGRLEVGRVFLGPHMESERMFSAPYGVGSVDPSNVERLPAGAQITQQHTAYDKLELQFRRVSAASHWNQWRRFIKRVGGHRDFVIVPFPDATGERAFWLPMYGRFENGEQLAKVGPAGNTDINAVLVEAAGEIGAE